MSGRHRPAEAPAGHDKPDESGWLTRSVKSNPIIGFHRRGFYPPTFAFRLCLPFAFTQFPQRIPMQKLTAWLKNLPIRFTLNSLQGQILLWIALPLAALVLAVSLSEVRGHQQVMQHMVQEQAMTSAQAAAQLISDQIGHRLDTLAHIAAHAQTRPDALIDPAVRLPVVRFDPAGQPAPASPQPVWIDWPATAHAVAGAVAAKTPQVLSISAAVSEGDGWQLVFAAPILDDGGTVAGVLVSVDGVENLGMARLTDLLRLGTDVEMMVKSADTDSIVAQIHLPGAEVGMGIEETVVARSTVTPVGWQVIVRQNWAAMVPPILRYESTIFLAVAMTVLAALLAFYFGLRGIATPLRRLDEAASRMGWGDFETIQQPVGGVREIEELRMALARMADQVRRHQGELQSYIGAMTTGQEEERKRVARELHDDTIQSLIALNQQVELVERQLVKDPDSAAKRLQDLRPLITDTIAGVRRQIHDLRPLYLEDLGFVPALEMLIKQTTEQHGLAGTFHLSGQREERLPAALEISAYRIAQEALRNVVAHAQASRVDLFLTFGPDEVELRIKDDGQGFIAPDHPYLLAEQGHYGLLGMHERAQQHGGRLALASAPGKGTTITVTLPIQESATLG